MSTAANPEAHKERDERAQRDGRRLLLYGVGLVAGIALQAATGWFPALFFLAAIVLYAVLAGIHAASHPQASRRLVPFVLVPAGLILLASLLSGLPHWLPAHVRPWSWQRQLSSVLWAFFWLVPCCIAFVMAYGVGRWTRPGEPRRARRSAHRRPIHGPMRSRAIPRQRGTTTDGRAVGALAIALACFAANMAHVCLAFLLIPLVTVLTVGAGRNCQPWLARVLLASTIAFGVTWLGVAANVRRFDLQEVAARLTPGVSSQPSWSCFETREITGFPIQGVEGNGSGGAQEHLPPGKGIGVLLANYLLCMAGACVLALLVPRRALSLSIDVAALGAFVTACTGWWQLMAMLD